jgi:hypothetical protein
MLAAIARKDYDDRRRRQMQGQAKAKAGGRYKGRAEVGAHCRHRRHAEVRPELEHDTGRHRLLPREDRQDREAGRLKLPRVYFNHHGGPLEKGDPFAFSGLCSTSRRPKAQRRGTAMPLYRIYQLDENGHVSDPPKIIEARTAAVAIAQAKQMDGYDLEIWNVSRCVGKIERRRR